MHGYDLLEMKPSRITKKVSKITKNPNVLRMTPSGRANFELKSIFCGRGLHAPPPIVDGIKKVRSIEPSLYK